MNQSNEDEKKKRRRKNAETNNMCDLIQHTSTVHTIYIHKTMKKKNIEVQRQSILVNEQQDK